MTAKLNRFVALTLCLLLAACDDGGKPWHATDITGAMPKLAFRMARANDAQVVTAENYRGRVVVLYFGYTHCPDICPVSLSTLSKMMAALGPQADQVVRRVQVPSNRPVSTRVPWLELPASLRDEVEKYLVWCSVPDPLDDEACARALAPETVRLRRDHIHLAASAACASGIAVERLTSLAQLVEPEIPG
jgi:hypothetical protein